MFSMTWSLSKSSLHINMYIYFSPRSIHSVPQQGLFTPGERSLILSISLRKRTFSLALERGCKISRISCLFFQGAARKRFQTHSKIAEMLKILARNGRSLAWISCQPRYKSATLGMKRGPPSNEDSRFQHQKILKTKFWIYSRICFDDDDVVSEMSALFRFFR